MQDEINSKPQQKEESRIPEPLLNTTDATGDKIKQPQIESELKSEINNIPRRVRGQQQSKTKAKLTEDEAATKI
jgi:hypothetical protein